MSIILQKKRRKTPARYFQKNKRFIVFVSVAAGIESHTRQFPRPRGNFYSFPQNSSSSPAGPLPHTHTNALTEFSPQKIEFSSQPRRGEAKIWINEKQKSLPQYNNQSWQTRRYCTIIITDCCLLCRDFAAAAAVATYHAIVVLGWAYQADTFCDIFSSSRTRREHYR